ncbi:MAG: VPLPA-CTERM sorting domain-containing protein [Proteobacteria bacterium]|nr:VPLPA-CTERM sorting domain-containing protein [Pseudomonadota bacterium]
MKKRFLGILFFGVLTLFLGELTYVSAALGSGIYGAETSTTTFYAPSYYTNFEGTYAGWQGETYAHSSFTDDRGSAEAESTLGLNINLKAKALHLSGLDNGAWATAQAIQGYTYTGAASTTLSLNAILTGSLYDPDASSRVYLGADIYVYQPINFGYYYDPGTLLGELGAKLFYDEDYENSTMGLEFSDTITDGSVSDSILLALDPGQSFYVVSILHARAVGSNSWADAYNTLNLTFDDTTDLVLGATTVPIPGAIWLMGSGLLGMIALIRRRSN